MGVGGTSESELGRKVRSSHGVPGEAPSVPSSASGSPFQKHLFQVGARIVRPCCDL